jgi:hypothetical protein
LESDARADKSSSVVNLSSCKPGSRKHQTFHAVAKTANGDPSEYEIHFGTSGVGAVECDQELEQLVGKASVMLAGYIAPLEVRECGPRGLGVFATHDIKAGEPVTFYPGRVARLLDHGFLDYGTGLFDSNCYGLRGDPRCTDASACGHLVNDPWAIAATVKEADAFWDVPGQATLLEYTNATVMTGMRSDYWLEALAHVAAYTNAMICDENCVISTNWSPDGGILSVITTEVDIPAGAELLTSYAPQYWLSRSLLLTSNALLTTGWHEALFAKYVELYQRRHQFRAFTARGANVLPMLIDELVSIDMFEERRNSIIFMDKGVDMMVAMANSNFENGRSHFVVEEFMAQWRAWFQQVRS